LSSGGVDSNIHAKPDRWARFGGLYLKRSRSLPLKTAAREWNGRLERVMILDQGFAWNGETYGSLSQVTKAMTGTSWNGHRFFGLRAAKSDRSAMVPRRSGVCDAASSDAASTPIKDGGAAFARRPSRRAASP
jgi:Protein of unknown function (DUF2924)